MPLGDWKNAYNVWMKLLDKYPEMVEEWDDFKILFSNFFGFLDFDMGAGVGHCTGDMKGDQGKKYHQQRPDKGKKQIFSKD